MTIEEACQRAVDGLGGLDDLVYCTGLISLVCCLIDANADVWRLTLETNFMGALLMTRAALPRLRR